MRKRSFQLTFRHRRWLYAVGGLLFLSGLFWWIADRVSDHGWLGTNFARGSKPWLLKIHGGAAMAFLFVLGTVWQNHIHRAWQAGQNRRSGALLVAWMSLLTFSGYGLYYFGDEHAREWTATIHDLLGFLAILVLLVHIGLGRRWMRSRALPRLSGTSH